MKFLGANVEVGVERKTLSQMPETYFKGISLITSVDSTKAQWVRKLDGVNLKGGRVFTSLQV